METKCDKKRDRNVRWTEKENNVSLITKPKRYHEHFWRSRVSSVVLIYFAKLHLTVQMRKYNRSHNHFALVSK